MSPLTSTLFVLSVIVTITSVESAVNYGRVQDLPGYNNSYESYSGYIDVPSSPNSSIYFWFYEAINQPNKAKKDIPIILWLQGGPGSSSSMGNIFQTIGPYYLTQKPNNGDIELTKRDVSWTDDFHVLFIDQPIGTGFSYLGDNADYVYSLNTSAQHLYEILSIFFGDLFPQFQSNQFYIAGEGYTAKFGPVYAQYILSKQRANSSSTIPALNGLAVGNGWNDPCFQMHYCIDTAQMLGIITAQEADDLNAIANGSFKTACDAMDYSEAFVFANRVIEDILHKSGDMDPYDYRLHEMPANEYDYTMIQTFFNDENVRDLLFVNTSLAKQWKFLMNSDPVLIALWNENMIDSTPYYVSLLDEYNIRVLLYQGQNDPLWTNQAQLEWIDQIKWNGNAQWLDSKQKSWTLKEDTMHIPVGFERSAGNLTWVEVFNAGHSTPMDQPAAAKQMIHDWIYT